MLQQNTFAPATAPDNHDRLAGIDLKTDPVENRLGTETFSQITHLNHKSRITHNCSNDMVRKKLVMRMVMEA